MNGLYNGLLYNAICVFVPAPSTPTAGWSDSTCWMEYTRLVGTIPFTYASSIESAPCEERDVDFVTLDMSVD